MYYAIVLPLTLLLPVICVAAQASAEARPEVLLLAGKWWVFWAGGVRLLLAGFRQVAQPSFTAREIFQLRETESFAVVRELGFANLAMGTIAFLSLWFPAWLVPAALANALYYGFAAVNHARDRAPKNGLRLTAMLTDFVVVAALAAFLASRWR